MFGAKSRKYRRREIPDPQVLDAAEQFEAARCLLDQEPPGSGVLLPLMNTAAMAVELFLKSLCAQHVYEPVPGPVEGLMKVTARPDETGHLYVKILDAIPRDIRVQLEDAYSDRTFSHLPGDLRDALKSYDGLLTTTRYPYEPNYDISRYSLAGLMELCGFLSDFVAALAPVDRIEYQSDAP